MEKRDRVRVRVGVRVRVRDGVGVRVRVWASVSFWVRVRIKGTFVESGRLSALGTPGTHCSSSTSQWPSESLRPT